MDRGKHQFWLLLVAALAVCAPAWAQRYSFKFYGEEEGLRNLGVQVVAQDRVGFLWVGTQNGLYRYDGSRFVEFSKNDGLPGTRIESLHSAADGTLWVGAKGGLARRVKERFETVNLGVAQGVVGRQAIATDAAGNLYLATENGLVLGSRTKEDFQFQLADGEHGGIRSVFLDGSGHVWYGCGTSLCTLENGTPRDVGRQQGLPSDKWFAILGSVDGDLWVRGEANMYRRRPGAALFEPLPKLPPSSNTNPTAGIDPDGRLLVPTDKGLARETASGWETISVEDGINTNDISAVFLDREGSVWLGLTGSGLARWLGYDEWQGWTEREGLSQSSIWSVTKDNAGRLWVGTRFGLNYVKLGEQQARGGKLEWKHQLVTGVEWPRALAPAADGSLWIAADAGGVVRLNPSTGQAQSFPLGQGESGIAMHVLVDHLQRVWVSTRGGLFRSNTASGEVHFEELIPAGGSKGERFVFAVEDASGQVWICGDQGVVRYRGEQSRRFTTADGLKANLVAQVAPAADGSVWIGYRDAFGLTQLSLQGDVARVKHVTAGDGSGLRSDKTMFLSFDQSGRLWVGTDFGVDVFDQTRWLHHGHSDGLIWNDCNSQAFLADANGVWIGTSRGLSRYQPRATPMAAVPPTVVFTAVRFGDKPWNGLGDDIPYDHMYVQLAALTFVQDAEVTFRVRLDGNEQIRQGTELNFASLDNGPHVLDVMARNAQGMWSVEAARIEFTIATPWYLSLWFRWGCILASLVFGRVMWQRRTYRLEAERHRLEKAVTSRTRELSVEKARAEHETAVVQEQKVEIERLLEEAQQASKLKSEFLANMSHEIRTPMNGVLGMTDLVLATPLESDQREYLEAARHAADSLLVILNDILDFSKIEAGRLDLNPVEFSLRYCLENTQKMFALPMGAKHLEYSAHVAEDVPDRLVGDPDRLRQVLLNLVGNAVKFTHTGSISIHIVRESEAPGWTALRFEVRDTGIGIPADKCGVIFESFRQADGSMTRKYGGTGLGLAICSRLVDLMGGKVSVESELGKGSVFQFTARFGIAAERPGDLENMARAVGASAQELATPTAEPAAILRVLLAEDNPINQRLATRLLERRGHVVSVIGTGREAMAMLEQGQFDVVLMDVQMPDMDGLQATALIREREGRLGLHTPIIALTAHTMKGDRERCLEAGMDSYITKPVNAAELIAVVEATAAQFATKS